MKTNYRRILVVVTFASLLIITTSCSLFEDHKGERGRGDAPVTHVNEGEMDLGVEMGDGYLNVGVKCIGPTGYYASTKGEGDAGGISEPKFMDPYCLGVYDSDGSVNDEQLKLYTAYLAAIENGNTEQAGSYATQLVANAPQERMEPDPMMR